MDGNLSEDTKCQMPKYKGCVDYDIPLDVVVEHLNYCCFFSFILSSSFVTGKKNYSAKKKTEKNTRTGILRAITLCIIARIYTCSTNTVSA